MRLRLLLVLAFLPWLAACGHSDEKTSISHTYQMRDEEGRDAGSVTFGPVGTEGVVRDANGNVVGRVIAPDRAPPPTPPAP